MRSPTHVLGYGPHLGLGQEAFEDRGEQIPIKFGFHSIILSSSFWPYKLSGLRSIWIGGLQARLVRMGVQL